MPSRCADKAQQILKATDRQKIASNPKRQKAVKLLYLSKRKYFP